MVNKADIQALDLGTKNIIRLGVCPTRTISMLDGISSGIEPIFTASYTRRYRTARDGEESVFRVGPSFIRPDDTSQD